MLRHARIDDLVINIYFKHIHQNHFSIKDLVVNMEKYSSMGRPGMWKVALFVSQDHDDSHVTKMGINILTLVEQTEES